MQSTERVLIADDADTSQFQAAVQSAVLKFKTEGVTHVFFMVAGGTDDVVAALTAKVQELPEQLRRSLT